METTVQSVLDLFASNAQIIKKEFTWQNSLAKRLAALLYAKENKPIDYEAIRQSHNIIKQNTGLFSFFRGDMAMLIAAMLSLSPNPQRLLDETLKVYEIMKDAKFRSSDYLVVAALEIASQANPGYYSDVVARARAFYDGMKADHFFKTGQDDYIFASMLGLSDLNVDAGVERIENIYNRLKSEFWDKNSVQTLAQILVLSRSDDNVVNRVLSLRDDLKAQKIKLDKSYTLSTLGILAMLPVDNSVIVRDIDEAQMMLRAQKGFGSMSVTMQEVLLFVTAIVTDRYAKSLTGDVLSANLSTSIANIIIAQNTALIVAITTSTSVAASSSS